MGLSIAKDEIYNYCEETCGLKSVGKSGLTGL